jgi:hypothetical protein
MSGSRIVRRVALFDVAEAPEVLLHLVGLCVGDGRFAYTSDSINRFIS